MDFPFFKKKREQARKKRRGPRWLNQADVYEHLVYCQGLGLFSDTDDFAKTVTDYQEYFIRTFR